MQRGTTPVLPYSVCPLVRGLVLGVSLNAYLLLGYHSGLMVVLYGDTLLERLRENFENLECFTVTDVMSLSKIGDACRPANVLALIIEETGCAAFEIDCLLLSAVSLSMKHVAGDSSDVMLSGKGRNLSKFKIHS